MSAKSNDDNKENNKKKKYSADDFQMYDLLVKVLNSSEHIRWTRFNTLLIVDSILLIAWATISSETSNLPNKQFLLITLCGIGFFLGLIWSGLGYRTSKYIESLNNNLEKMDEEDKIHNIKPYEDLKNIRVGGLFYKFTSSKLIVTWIPILFSILFLVLFHISIQPFPKIDDHCCIDLFCFL